MARFSVLELSYIGDRLRHPGEEIEYSGEVHKNLQPLDDPAKKLAAKGADTVAENFKAQLKLHAAARGDDPNNVTAADFAELTKDTKWPSDVVSKVAAELGVKLGVADLS